MCVCLCLSSVNITEDIKVLSFNSGNSNVPMQVCLLCDLERELKVVRKFSFPINSFKTKKLKLSFVFLTDAALFSK